MISAGATESCTSGRPPSTCLAERAIPYQNNRNLDSVRHQQHHQSSNTFAGPGISPARANRRYRRRPAFVVCLCSDTLACPPSRGNCQFFVLRKKGTRQTVGSTITDYQFPPSDLHTIPTSSILAGISDIYTFTSSLNAKTICRCASALTAPRQRCGG